MRRCFSRAVVRICRQWTGGKTGVPVAAVLLAALWLLPALQPLLASPPRAAQYEAYPAVGWQKLDEVEQKRLTRIAYGGKDYDSMVRAWSTKLKAGVCDEPFPEYSYRWADAEPHPELARLLPTVHFLGRRTKLNSSTAPYWYSTVANHKGKLYDLQSLNKLLVDVGFKFDTSEVPAIAKIAVLWTLMDQHAGNAFGLGPDSAALATAIPAVTFRKIERREWRDERLHDLRRAAVVRVVVTGKEMEFTVGMRPGTWQPEFIAYEGGSVTFDEVFRPRGALDGDDAGPNDSTQWTIAVTGDVWTETDDSSRVHYFLLADSNGTHVGRTCSLAVNVGAGLTIDSIWFRFYRVQGATVDTWHVAPVASGFARLAWSPNFAKTAEYKVTAHQFRDSAAMSLAVILDPEAWRTGVLSPGNGS